MCVYMKIYIDSNGALFMVKSMDSCMATFWKTERDPLTFLSNAHQKPSLTIFTV